MLIKVCNVCGNKYTTQKKTQKTCSHACRDESMRGRKNTWAIGNKHAAGNIPWNIGKKMPEDAVKKMSEKHKGLIPWNKGMKYTEEEKSQLNLSGLMEGHKTENRKKALATRKEKYGYIHSPEQRKKFSEMFKGEKSHWWKGGKSAVAHRLRESAEMKQWKKDVFERDDWTCQECKQRGGKLIAHHIKSFAYHPELRFDVNNGQTLCIDCHKQTDNYGKH